MFASGLKCEKSRLPHVSSSAIFAFIAWRS